jgi:primosomal protein N' (replication factor Y) (superfamily II helicase)
MQFNNEISEEVFVDLILPVPIPQLFTYRLPNGWQDQVNIGYRVVVEFGKSRILTAVVVQKHSSPPENYKAKYILEILDHRASVNPKQLWLFQWIADYYMCNVGEVFNVALPAGLKISSQSKIQMNPSFERQEDLDAEEKLLLDALISKDNLDFDEAAKIVAPKDISTLVKQLVAKHAIIIFEELSERYKPKTEKRLKLAAEYIGTDEMLSLISKLEKNQKQQAIILKYLAEIPLQDLANQNERGVAKTVLKDENSDSALNSLIKKEILVPFEVEVSRFEETAEKNVEIRLSEIQKSKANQILKLLSEKRRSAF